MPFRDPVVAVTTVDKDSPNTLAFNFGTVIGGNIEVIAADVNVTLLPGGKDLLSGYQSVFGHLRWVNTSGAFNYARIVLQYWDSAGTVQVGQDTFAVNPSFTGGLTDRTFFRMPLRGERVKLIITNMSANPGTISYSLFASHRAVDRPYYEESFGPVGQTQGYGSDGLLAYQSTTIIANTTYPIAVHQGRVIVAFRNGAASTVAASVQVTCSAVDFPDINGWIYNQISVPIGSSAPPFELILPARPCKMVVNGGVAPGVAFNFAVVAQDR